MNESEVVDVDNYAGVSTNKRSLGINKACYKKSIQHLNIKHDSYFNVIDFAKQNHPLDNGFLSENMLLKRNPKTSVIQLPYPIGYPNRYLKDPCRELIDKKLNYINDFNHYVKLHQKKAFCRENLENYTHLPKYIIDLVEGKIVDPDPYLKTNYDFYYTGGFLDKCYINNNLHLIRAIDGNILGFIDIYNSKTDTCFNFDSPIYNINTHKNGNKLFVLIRHKNKLSLQKIKYENNAIALEELWFSTANQTSYIDFKLNKFNTNVVFTLKVNSKLSVCNWENHKKIDIKLKSNIFQFDAMNENTLFMISPEEISIYDIRTNNTNLLRKPDKNMLDCDYLSALAFSQRENYVYVTSTHHVMKIDLRTLKTVEKHAHLLSKPPIMCKSIKQNGIGVLYAASDSYKDKFVMVDDGLCQRVPNIFDTYQETCLHYKAILKRNLENHMKLSTGGICLEDNDEGVQLYSSNSIGDITCNNITKEQLDNEMPCTTFLNWVDNIIDEQEVIQVTDIRPLNSVKTMLTKTTINEKRLDRYVGENKHLDRFLNLEVADNNLNLIEIWEEDDKENDCEEGLNANDKVSNWLDDSFI